MLKKLDTTISSIEDCILALLLGLMSLAVLSQIIFRNFLGSSLPWSEELARFCMVWIVFFSVGAGIKDGAHMGVDAIVNILPIKFRFFVVLLAKIIMAALCVVFFFLSLQLTIALFGTGQKSATMLIPIAAVYMVMPIGFLSGAIRSALQAASHIQNRNIHSETDTG